MEKCNRVKTRKRRKQLFVDRFGGKCQICGYNKCINSLIFHHVDKNTKEFSPCDAMNISIERGEKELEKCILICANCHGEIHSENYNYEYDISNLFTPWHEITCEFCNKKFKTKRLDLKFCGSKCSQLSQRKVKDRPTESELKKLIDENTWTDIGRIFGVSDNTIRKWARKYELI